MQQNTQPLLEGKKIADPFIQYKTDLLRAYEGSATPGILGKIFGGGPGSKLLTKENAALGLSLINQHPDHKEPESQWAINFRPTFNGERYKFIKKATEDDFNSQANYNLLIFFFGEEKAGYARHAWQRLRYQMYQAGTHRRSFRTPEDRTMYFQRQLDFIIFLLRQSYNQRYEDGYKYNHYDLSITDQIRYNHLVGDTNPELFRLWSSAIDLGNTAVLQLLEDIVYGKDADGKITRSIIKSLLSTERREAWVVVEKLLLAAQRQEGLRQTILEALDETSIGALKHMIRVIIDQDLARFSSVVRAVDVWAGLGWESERETTVRHFLEMAAKYLDDQDAIPAAIRSENNADVYMALWALAVHDVEKTIPFLHELYRTGDTGKRTLALMFAIQANHNKLRMPIYIPALADEDLPPLALAAHAILATASITGNEAIYNKTYPELFDQLHAVYKRVTVKEKTFEGFVFSWNKIHFERKTILQAMLALSGDMPHRLEIMVDYLEDMDSIIKGRLSSKILPEYSGYTRIDATKDPKPKQPLTAFQRKFALQMLRDRSEFNIGFKALREEPLSAEELAPFPEWLKRKGADFRGNILTILLKQEDQKLSPIVGGLLRGDGEQRAAGLDILLQLKKTDRILPEAAAWIEAFRERKISSKEEILLTQLTDTTETRDISAASGFGIYDPAKCAPVVKPAIDPQSTYERLLEKQPYALSMPLKKITEAMQELSSLLEQHMNYEYEVVNYGGSKEMVLLGNTFRTREFQSDWPSAQEKYQTYPLPEVWAAWHDKWKFEPRDLELLLSAFHSQEKATRAQLPVPKDFVPEKFLNRLNHYGSPFRGVLIALNELHPMENRDEFFLAAATRLFASLSEAELKIKPQQIYYGSHGDGWQQNRSLHVFSDKVKPETMEEKLVPLYWNLFNWRQYSGREENFRFALPPLIIFCRAYEQGVIKEDDMLRGLLHPDNIRTLSSKVRHARDFDFYGRFGFLRTMFDSVRDQLLDIEVIRGDTPTPVTPLVGQLRNTSGVHRLTQLMAGLGKSTLLKGYYYWGTSDTDKQTIFSNLIKICHPLETDTQQQFDEDMKRIKATESRLIEIAMYAPQWQRFVSRYLGWEGLDDAIWWMHAHTKTDGYRAQNAEAESEIARYSSLDVEEFKEGAVDKEWFIKAYAGIGGERWPLVYDAAKYITDGNGHRRARIYADVLLGNLTLKEVTEKIGSKRDQDYVRIYGLAPLDHSDVPKDILSRYAFIQEFKKGSRQFGAQKQASEAAAIKVAMDNLARNAGYPDPIRLTWAMETQQVQAILAKETQVQIEDMLIGLVIDEEGGAEVVAFKGDKQLKAIPAKYRKDARVEELNNFKKLLREQYRRSRKGLEEAMVRGDIFLYKEIRELSSHPVIARHLEKLVFILQGRAGHGFYQPAGSSAEGAIATGQGMLVDDQGEVTTLLDTDTMRIAHCVDLHHTKSWAGYQRQAFDRKLQQPFKQIFRELYLPTPDELHDGAVSRRYAGHQVQPKQTVALLRTRGWKVNYEEGLQKVYHKEGFAARMFALADWFSPAEVESPTLETVVFQDLKTGKNVPFTTINPLIFSEVMRDMDLVVSVAHAGGVDPEASHSSIEMRAVLLRETIRLFKLDNVTVDGSHARIKGTMGDYSVHLGSAVVHRVLSGYLSILPVHSQHRGRIFLPFVDDDPRSAELLSKVLLLARDKEIKDPLILQQLG